MRPAEPRTRHILVDDHAFAGGPVFLRPASFIDALRQTRGWRSARLLMAVWRTFDHGATLGSRLRLGCGARLVNPNGPAAARIGDGCVVRGILRLEATGRLAIGDDVYIGDGCIVSAMDDIEIGSGTLLAHGAQVFDNDTHPVDAEQRVADFRAKLGHPLPGPVVIGHAPVRIGRRCWLGLNSIVMKGVTIGDGTIVASGGVVVDDLPAGVVAAGNPARVVKVLAG